MPKVAFNTSQSEKDPEKENVSRNFVNVTQESTMELMIPLNNIHLDRELRCITICAFIPGTCVLLSASLATEETLL